MKKIEKQHKMSIEVEYEYLFLKDMDFKLCKGCHACISHGEEKCSLKDDRDLIISKIEHSDGVILASPNYVMNVSWLMKNFIDRLAYTLHRPRFFNQHFMILITSGSYMGAKQAMNALSVMSSGGKIVSKLMVFNSPGMNENKRVKRDKKITQAAEKFQKALSKKSDHKPSFGFLIWFSVFKASSAESREYFPADYDFYENKHYFVDYRLNLFQKVVVRLFTGFFTFLVRRGLV